jgi:hypothetical protein
MERPADTVHWRGFRAPRDAHSTRMVNDRLQAAHDLWFRNRGWASAATFRAMVVINRKFTPNRIIPVFREFSAALPQWKHFRFIDGW